MDITGYDYSDIDIEGFWDKTADIYPRKSNFKTAKTLWMDKFAGIAPDKAEWLAKTIFKAIKMYLKDYTNTHKDGEDYQYVKTLDRWFNEDFDYWFKKAEKTGRVTNID